jgi:hypothetical protein
LVAPVPPITSAPLFVIVQPELLVTVLPVPLVVTVTLGSMESLPRLRRIILPTVVSVTEAEMAVSRVEVLELLSIMSSPLPGPSEASCR